MNTLRHFVWFIGGGIVFYAVSFLKQEYVVLVGALIVTALSISLEENQNKEVR